LIVLDAFLWRGSDAQRIDSPSQHINTPGVYCLLSPCRFLDAQRIHSLTRYLEQLHACGLGTADHTTLLLNCYTKLKDVEKLDAFLHRNAGSSSGRGAAGVVGGGAAGMAVLAAAEKASKRHSKGSKAEGDRFCAGQHNATLINRMLCTLISGILECPGLLCLPLQCNPALHHSPPL
jgi:hypothetical protein